MNNLVLVLISGEEFETNLAESLAQPGDHPWGFSDWKRQMQALSEGANIAFVEFLDSGGRQVKRFTSSEATLTARRIVLAKVSRSIDWVEEPKFPGYNFAFSFGEATDEHFSELLDLDEVSRWLNTRLPALDLEAGHLGELVRHAKSNKVGVYIDGRPRKAGYFPDPERPGERAASAPRSAASEPPTIGHPDRPASHSGLGKAIGEFSDAVSTAGIVFSGLNTDLPAAFVAALAAKRFAILSGLSGSGKTQLARALGQWLGADEQGARYAVIPVRPDWTSPEPLLGYEDALLPSSGGRRAWAAPAPLRFVLRAAADPAHLYLLVLDEMNLAHVERYFADVLSGIESGERILPPLQQESDGHWRVDPAADLISMPTNLLVVGTVNVDETTYQFSPKVLDRAFSFEFRVASAELGLATKRPSMVEPGSASDLDAIRAVVADDAWHLKEPSPKAEEVSKELVDLHEKLSAAGFEFGHRTFFEAMRLAATLAAAGLEETEEVLDWTLMTKVLPRIHGSRRQLEPLLVELLEAARPAGADEVWRRSAQKIARMLATLRANQFVSFAE